MKEIKLANGKGIVLVDDQEYSKLSSIRWFLKQTGKNNYAQGRVNGKMTRMHRFILDVPPLMEVDHINGNGLDNRKNNLRSATSLQNHWNRKIPINNHSGFKGVHYVPQRSHLTTPWRAMITINNKSRHIGCYSSKEEAAKAYNKKAKELFGEFANINKKVLFYG